MHYKRHELSAGRVVDGTATVITAGDSRMHELNETGTWLWQHADSPLTIDEMVALLVGEFDVDEATARTDVEQMVADFVTRGIFEPVEG